MLGTWLTQMCSSVRVYNPGIFISVINTMLEGNQAQKVLVVGAGPVGALAALNAASRGDDVHVYELRAGMNHFFLKNPPCFLMVLVSLDHHIWSLYSEETHLCSIFDKNKKKSTEDL